MGEAFNFFPITLPGIERVDWRPHRSTFICKGESLHAPLVLFRLDTLMVFVAPDVSVAIILRLGFAKQSSFEMSSLSFLAVIATRRVGSSVQNTKKIINILFILGILSRGILFA